MSQIRPYALHASSNIEIKRFQMNEVNTPNIELDIQTFPNS